MTEMDHLDHVARGLQGFPGIHTKVTIELTQIRFESLKRDILEEYDNVEFVPVEKNGTQICFPNIVGRYGLMLYGIRFTFIVRG